MIPLPAIVYYQLTLPLQLLASRLGATGLVALGIHTVRQGNLLFLPNCTLNVVEACSGIRSLLSLLAAVLAYGYLAEPSTWKRGLLAVASIPIAIADQRSPSRCDGRAKLLLRTERGFWSGPFGTWHWFLRAGFSIDPAYP